MKISVQKSSLKDILPLRNLFLQETNFQIRYNACHERGWTDSYLIKFDGKPVGYGSVMGQEIKNRDTIFEFYLTPQHRRFASSVFSEFIQSAGVPLIECQSNDFLLTTMLYEFAENVNADVVLFEEHAMTNLTIPGAVFRRRRKDETFYCNRRQDDPADFVVEIDGEIVASGGFLLHYNMPFADLYMETCEGFRRRGLGSYILQEIKKECYLAGRVPAARCNIGNFASRGALTKAGLRSCGFMLKGKIKSFKS